MSEQQSETAARPSGKPKRQTKQKKVERSLMEQAMLNFAACGRCSYFWAGSQVLVGVEQATTAVEQRQDGWITLPWNQAMSNLIHKSYGVLMDSDFYHYEGCCPECRRLFVVQLREAQEVADANGEVDTAVPDMGIPEPLSPASFVFDLEKYDTMDAPDSQLPPPQLTDNPFVLRVELVIG
ncbi:MAG TPA: hypothetical protein PLD25_27625 [Chloroflexota bacterium]|nr:hypothetical protein [Chloroflexota bacterium]